MPETAHFCASTQFQSTKFLLHIIYILPFQIIKFEKPYFCASPSDALIKHPSASCPKPFLFPAASTEVSWIQVFTRYLYFSNLKSIQQISFKCSTNLSFTMGQIIRKAPHEARAKRAINILTSAILGLCTLS